MKRVLILACSLFISVQSPANAAKSNDTLADVVHDFYLFYIHEGFEKLKPCSKMKDTLEKYCTPSFLRRISEDEEIDVDPFILAQDIDGSWRESMTIQKCSGNNPAAYKVCLWQNVYAGNKPHCLKVLLEQVQGRWKIDNVKRMQ